VALEARAQESAEVKDTEATREVELLASELLVLRSELVDLRAQLAEAHAVNLSSSQEMVQLKRNQDEALGQVSSLSDELSSVKKEAEKIAKAYGASQADHAETGRLNEQLLSLRQELAVSNLQASQYAAKSERLEQELVEVRVAGMGCEFQATSLEKQLQEARANASDTARAGDLELRRLRHELKDTRDKLSQRNSEIIRQAAEHLQERQRTEEEYDQKQQLARNALPHKVASKNPDDNVEISKSESRPQARPIENKLMHRAGNWESSVLMDQLRRQVSPSIIDDDGGAIAASENPHRARWDEDEEFHQTVNRGSSVFMDILREKLDLK
jgi:hypothetical protein